MLQVFYYKKDTNELVKNSEEEGDTGMNNGTKKKNGNRKKSIKIKN